MIHRKKRLSTSISGIVLGVCSIPVLAADTMPVLEEIVITARRVSENIQDAPITVSAITGNSIENAGITNVTEIAALVPNVNLAPVNFFSGDISPFIRGIGTFDQEMTFDPAVSVVVDGIYLSRTSGAMPDLFDVERVEVLRGPQGTVFGRNSLAGALNIVTKRPAHEQSLKISATVGDYGQQELALRTDIPLTDKIFSKISIQQVKHDGYYSLTLNDGTETYDRLASLLGVADGATLLSLYPAGTGPEQLSGRKSDFGGTENLTIRPAITYEINDTSSITLLGEIARLESQPSGFNTSPAGVLTMPNGTPLPSPSLGGTGTYALSTIFGDIGGIGTDTTNLNKDSFDISLNVDALYKLDIDGIYLEGIFGLGEGELTVNTGYREITRDVHFDPDGSSIDLFNVDRIEEFDQTTFEAKYNAPLAFSDGAQYILGVFYLTDESQQKDRFSGAAITLGSVANGGPFIYESFGAIAQERDSYAIYGTIDYPINDQWRMTAGLRYSYEEKDFRFIENGLCQNASLSFSDCGVPGLPVVAMNENWENLSPKLTLDYQVNDDILIYGIIATAFRSGGFNGRAPTRADLGPFGDEEVLSYELGSKTDLFNGRIRLNTAVFLNQYKDLQREFQIGNARTVNQNAAEGDMLGFELELTAIPFESIPDLIIKANYGFLDFEYDTYAGDLNADGVDEDISGNELPRAPRHSAGLELQYEHYIGNGKIQSRIAYSWQDESYISHQNFEELKTDSYGLLDMSIGYTHENADDSSTKITLFGKNLTDEHVLTNGSAVVGNFQVADMNSPRQLELRIAYEY